MATQHRWCWMPTQHRWCCAAAASTCAATAPTSARLRPRCCSAPATRRWWTARWPAVGWAVCSRPPQARHRRLSPTPATPPPTSIGNKPPARWPCVVASPSSPAAPAPARHTPPPACWRCAGPCTPHRHCCGWRWLHPLARPQRGCSSPSALPCIACSLAWRVICRCAAWPATSGRPAPCTACWAPGRTPGACRPTPPIRWRWTC